MEKRTTGAVADTGYVLGGGRRNGPMARSAPRSQGVAHGLHAVEEAFGGEECSPRVPRSAPPAFLELLPPAAGRGECVVELESAGGKIRVAMKGMMLDWGGLLRAWREAAR